MCEVSAGQRGSEEGEQVVQGNRAVAAKWMHVLRKELSKLPYMTKIKLVGDHIPILLYAQCC